MINKKCIFCKLSFIDKTKNSNRSNCGSGLCKKEQSKLYRKNRDQIKYKANQERFKENNPNYLKEWRVKNKEQDRKLNREYKANRFKEDACFKLAHNLRHRLYRALKNNQKTGSAVSDLGCSVEYLIKHLEDQFTEGMTWDNYGLHGWHIDHIKPLAKYNLQNKEELLEACHYTNLQPMWAKDNWSKGDNCVI